MVKKVNKILFFLPCGSVSFFQKIAPLPCSFFNDQITILSFPPSWIASAKNPIASGGNIFSVAYFLMKVQCHSLKKQLIIFPASPSHCCKESICQALRGQAAATRHLHGNVEAGASGLPSMLAGLHLVHWDKLTALVAPVGDGTSCGDSTCYSNSFSPPTPVHKQFHGWICSCEVWMETRLWLVWAAGTERQPLRSPVWMQKVELEPAETTGTFHEWRGGGHWVETAKGPPDMQVFHPHQYLAAHAIGVLAWDDATSWILPCRVWHLNREGDFQIPVSSGV